ncbi:lysosomal acid glucosylceramidase-like isoform 1-T2 [Aphomia sociella]
MGVFKTIHAIFLLCVILFVQISTCYNKDKQCHSKAANNSVICICTADYCDEITRETPMPGRYLAYTSSQGGLRFTKTTGLLTPGVENKLRPSLVLNPSKQYQTIEGFGAAVTDSAGINWLSLKDEKLKEHLINSYFGSKGIEYNMIRLPIGGTDFSTRPYTYQDFPENDTELSHFRLAYEDYNYKIPMIKASMNVATAPIQIVGSCWSPPVWMKYHYNFTGTSRLRSTYTQTYADYHLKFLESYAKENITVWALTTTNEPLSGIMSLGSINRLGWTTKGMGQWIANNLGPTIRNSKFKNVKILACDDQRFTLPIWYNVVIQETPEADKYIDGLAVHFYFDELVPPEIFSKSVEDHPEKFILNTEASTGVSDKENPVLLGSWDRAQQYIKDIIQDLNYNLVAWMEWNLCLNEKGGPTYVGNNIDAPIIVFPDKKQFVKQPMYYALGHFSKFIPRGSKRIDVKSNFPSSFKLDNVAFLTPNNTIVVVLYNDSDQARVISIQQNGVEGLVLTEPKSVVTVEF